MSIPDEVLKEIERLARRGGRSRSEIIRVALSEYVARHAPDEVTDAINHVIADQLFVELDRREQPQRMRDGGFK